MDKTSRTTLAANARSFTQYLLELDARAESRRARRGRLLVAVPMFSGSGRKG